MTLAFILVISMEAYREVHISYERSSIESGAEASVDHNQRLSSLVRQVWRAKQSMQ